MDKISSTSTDLIQENIKKLKNLFPNAFADGFINIEVLKEMLGEDVDINNEKYEFRWPGKTKAVNIAYTPSKATLRLDRDKSYNLDNAENIYIEGDNLEVLKVLQKTYAQKVKLIYIDPPYNTGLNLIYKNNFYSTVEDYLAFTDKDEEAERLSMSNPETNGRFHSDWDSMMYSRLLLARTLLRDDGFIAIAIDENELGSLMMICNEIFGETNRLAVICVVHKPEGRNQAKFFGPSHEYMLVYAKDITKAKLRKVVIDEEKKKEFNLEDESGAYRLKKFIRLSDGKYATREAKPAFYYPIYVSEDLSKLSTTEFENCKPVYPITDSGQERTWKTTKETAQLRISQGDIIAQRENGKIIILEKLRAEQVLTTHWINKKYHGFHYGTKIVDNLLGFKSFDFPKSLYLMKDIVTIFTEKDDLVLDFFSGSATTGHAVIKQNIEDKQNRRFILVQLPEKLKKESEAYKKGYRTICDLGELRLKRAFECEYDNQKNTLFEENIGEMPGFKVFKLDSTNIIAWDNENKLDGDSLFDFTDVFKKDRNNEDVLYEIMLKYGIFDMPVQEININGKVMYRIGGRYMIVCLSDDINSDDVKAIGNLKPSVVVFKDNGFKNDNVKINAMYNLKNAGVEDVKSI